MTAYYNEHDPKKAVALQALMDAGHIAPGEISTKDIRDVSPDELSGFTQCHFFAGIGLWSVAARAAGIDDGQPLWSGSCPCQPYSAAGGGGGLADDRHLWPHWYWLIAQCRPNTVVGEQVASKDGLGWLDIVSADMEGADYTGGALDLCSAGFGPPNIRQRLYMCWLADASCAASGRDAGAISGAQAQGTGQGRADGRHDHRPCDGGDIDGMVNSDGSGLQRQRGHGSFGNEPRRVAQGPDRQVARASDAGGLGSAEQERRGEARAGRTGKRPAIGNPVGGMAAGSVRDPLHLDPNRQPARTDWDAVDWLLCRGPDGPKLRPVRPGAFVLAPSHPGRNHVLRGIGDAINLEVATAFLETVKLDLEG